MCKLIVGCGYLGCRVAQKWLALGKNVIGLVADDSQAEELQRRGIQPLIANITQPESLGGLPPVQTVLFCVSYDARYASSPEQLYVEGLQSLLNALPPGAERFLLTSSLGVYGRTDGSLIDEQTSCRPQRESAKALLDAEKLLTKSSLGERAIVLRLGALYGEERIERKRYRLATSAQSISGEGYLNFIHVDDAAATVLAAEVRAKPPATYVVSDGHPLKRSKYHQLLSQWGGKLCTQVPESFQAVRSHREHSSITNQRANNRRMIDELQIQLLFPSFEHFVMSKRCDS